MKRSMKFLVLTLVVSMLLSMSAFAATVEYKSLTPVEDGDNYDVTVTYDASGYAAGDQVTMLLLTGSDEIQFDTTDATKPTNVLYIDQQTISATAAEGTTRLEGSFTFTIAKDDILNNEVYVKLGATSQTAADEYTYQFTTSTDPDQPGEGGEDDEGGDDTTEVTVTVNSAIADAFGVTGLKIAKVTDIPVGKVVTATGADVIYGTYEGNTYCYILSTGEISASTVTLVDGTPETVVLGNADFSEDGLVNIFDATAVLDYIATPSLLNTNVKKFLADVNYDGAVNIFDATGVLDVLTGTAPGAAQ